MDAGTLHVSQPILVNGQVLKDIPEDLFIPPDALEVLLDSFSGPLDLLLYLIKKQNIDIFDIPIVPITRQYLHYIELMEAKRMELASDYLVMAAMLAEIKSRMLLPVTPDEEHEEEDPRMALVRRLQAYEQIKQAAEDIDALLHDERDVYSCAIDFEGHDLVLHPDVLLTELVDAMRDLLKQKGHQEHHQISLEPLSVRERMGIILDMLNQGQSCQLQEFFTKDEGVRGLVVSFLAVLELAREMMVRVTQVELFGLIHVRAV